MSAIVSAGGIFMNDEYDDTDYIAQQAQELEEFERDLHKGIASIDYADYERK